LGCRAFPCFVLDCRNDIALEKQIFHYWPKDRVFLNFLDRRLLSLLPIAFFDSGFHIGAGIRTTPRRSGRLRFASGFLNPVRPLDVTKPRIADFFSFINKSSANN